MKINEECRGCIKKCSSQLSGLRIPTIRVAKISGEDFIYSRCPCMVCIVKGMCNQKCDDFRKHEMAPKEVTIYSESI